MYTKTKIFLLSFVFLNLLLGKIYGQDNKTRKPNIVFIMADDLGWRDTGFNDADFFETPNIDRLRESGMNFTNSYPGAANCAPSRAMIMTGMYSPRTKIWTPGGKAKGEFKYMKFLVPNQNKDTETIQSKLELSPEVNTLAKTLKSAGYSTAHFGKWHLGDNGLGFDINDTNGKGGKLGQNFYGNIDVHENLTDATINYIKKNKDNPFFIYLCHWDVHTPISCREEYKQIYEDKLAAHKWNREWNTTYAGMIHAVDLSVKRIWETLKKENLLENTLIIFTSDNGGLAQVTWNDPLKGAKGAFYEGGIRVPTCKSWKGVIEPGTTCDIAITGVDYLPTFAELAGVNLPKSQPVDGKSIVSLLYGKQILTERSLFWHFPLYLKGDGYNKVQPVYGTEIMYWRATPCSVIRKGKWKLLYFYESETCELYNLEEDISEKIDLSKSNIEKAAELLEELKQWVKNAGADVPVELNPDFSMN